MAESRRTDRLLVWSLAAFHTGFLVAVLVTVLFWTGGLAGLLSGLNTLAGLAIYLVLWLTTGWTTQRAVAGVVLSVRGPAIADREVIGRGIVWGGVNGVLFFLAIVAGLFIVSLRAFDPSLLLFLLFGSLAAFVIGAVVGVVFAIIDVILLDTSQRVVLGMLDGEGFTTNSGIGRKNGEI